MNRKGDLRPHRKRLPVVLSQDGLHWAIVQLVGVYDSIALLQCGASLCLFESLACGSRTPTAPIM